MLKANSSLNEYPYEILAIIPKYRTPLVKGEKCPLFYVIVKSLEPGSTKKIDYFTLRRYTLDDKMQGTLCDIVNKHLLNVGEFISKDDVFTEVEKQDNNKPTVVQINISLNEDYNVANLYKDTCPGCQIIPNIGSQVREDGVIFASSPKRHIEDSLYSLEDDIFYVEPEATVIDINFLPNRYKTGLYPQQVNLYIHNEMMAYEDIYKVYLKYKDTLTPSENMKSLITHALHKLIAANYNRSMFSKDIVELFSKSSENPVSYLNVRVVLHLPTPVLSTI